MNRDAWTEVLLSAFLSIPIGVLVGLLVPHLRTWYRTRGKTNAAALLAFQREEYLKVLFYREHPVEFTHFLLKAITHYIEYFMLWCLFTSVAVGTIGTAFAVKAAGHKVYLYNRTMAQIISAFGFVCSTWMVMAFMLNYLRVHSMWSGVKDFDSYLKTVPKEIRAIQLLKTEPF